MVPQSRKIFGATTVMLSGFDFSLNSTVDNQFRFLIDYQLTSWFGATTVGFVMHIPTRCQLIIWSTVARRLCVPAIHWSGAGTRCHERIAWDARCYGHEGHPESLEQKWWIFGYENYGFMDLLVAENDILSSGKLT